MCGVDPSKLILEYVNREFEGNYSCEGSNTVGESPKSKPVPLEVMYPPGQAQIITKNTQFYKNLQTNITCQVGVLC